MAFLKNYWVILKILEENSHESTTKKEVRYLNFNKKVIYYKYLEDENNRRIRYNTFVKYIPKNFKVPTRRTDVCGICEI